MALQDVICRKHDFLQNLHYLDLPFQNNIINSFHLVIQKASQYLANESEGELKEYTHPSLITVAIQILTITPYCKRPTVSVYQNQLYYFLKTQGTPTTLFTKCYDPICFLLPSQSQLLTIALQISLACSKSAQSYFYLNVIQQTLLRSLVFDSGEEWGCVDF